MYDHIELFSLLKDRPFRRRVLINFAALVLICGLCAVAAFYAPHFGYLNELTMADGVRFDSNKLRDVVVVPAVLLLQLIVIFFFGKKLFREDTFLYALWLFIFVLALCIFLAKFLLLRWMIQYGVIAASLMAGFMVVLHAFKERWEEALGHALILAAGTTFGLAYYGGLDALGVFIVAFPGATLLLTRLSARAALGLSAAMTCVLTIPIVLSAPSLQMGRSLSQASPLDGVHAAAALTLLIQARSLVAAARAKEARMAPPPSFSVAMAITILSAPETRQFFLPNDDYHFGEYLLAAQALAEGGGWFTTFFSPHGFSDAIGAVIAFMLGDETAVGIRFGFKLSMAYAVALLNFRFVALMGPGGAALCAFLAPYIGAAGFVLLFLVLLFEIATSRRPIVAGLLGALASAANVFLNGGFGGAVALGTATAGLVFHGLKGRRNFLRFVGSGLVGAFGVWAAFQSEVAGQFRFLAISAQTNLDVYGNGDLRVFIYYVQHLFFMISPFFLIMLYVSRPHRAAGADFVSTQRLTLVTAPIVVMALFFNSYAMGRLDDRAPRAAISSLCVLLIAPIWLGRFEERRRAPLRAVAACCLVAALLANSSSRPHIGALLTRPAPEKPRLAISTELSRLGAGGYDAAHVRRLEDIGFVVRTILEPDETFVNLSNRNALFYYFDRKNSLPIASPYNAAPEAFQQDFIAAWRADPPPLAVIGGSIEHDGGGLSLRSHWIYRFLLENYRPFLFERNIYAIRKDQAHRLTPFFEEARRRRERSAQTVYRLDPLTNADWSKGIAIGEKAEIWSFVVDPLLGGALKKGDRLSFSDGVERVVVAAEGAYILSSPTLAPSNDASEISFTIADGGDEAPSDVDLWAAAFHRRDLGRAPSAWGRSLSRLAPSLSPSETKLAPALSSDGRSSASSAERIYVPETPISPQEDDLFLISASCQDKGQRPIVRVFWRSEGRSFSDKESISFEASFAQNLAPLDASPYWRLSEKISEIKVALENAHQCAGASIEAKRFYKRIMTKQN